MMADNKNKKNSGGSKGKSPGSSNDQLGENAGEGRMMKSQTPKNKKKS